MAYLLLRRARRAWQLRRRYDAGQQHGLLLEGEPRNAIVACWHRFEVQGERSGLPRHPWETSSEFALRMLDLAEVDSSAVSRLLAGYSAHG